MAPSRGCFTLQSTICSRPCRYICSQCRSRLFATAATLNSGHNRWSKIKHDKGRADAAKNRQRSVFSHEIATASKLFGPEPSANPRLADLIAKAKKEGFAKANIEAAIARGQGKSSTGASLEGVTVEGLLPGNIGVVIECETDNRLRTLQEARLIMKNAGGSATPSAYLFSKRGRLTFDSKDDIGAEETLEAALEAGAIDVEDGEDSGVLVFCEPGETKVIGEAVSAALGLDIKTSEIIWYPNEDTKVGVENEDAAQDLAAFVEELQGKESSVQAVAMNVAQGSLSSEIWKELQSRLNT